MRPVGFVLGLWVKDKANGELGEVGAEDVGAVVGGVHPGGDDGLGRDGCVAGHEVFPVAAARVGEGASSFP